MKNIFIGRLRYWLLWVVLFGVLGVVGNTHLHTRDFTTFLAVLVGLVAGCVAVIVLSYRKSERITREPLGDD